MANPNGRSWRHGRARCDLSVDEAAGRLGIKAGSLRNIETDQPNYSVSERLAYRAARLYGTTYDELVLDEGENEKPKPKPPPKPKREKDPSAPPPRKNGKGPKRTSEVAA